MIHLDKAAIWLKNQDHLSKASIRAAVEHPFGVIKCQFGYRKVRYKGLAKNHAQVMTLFALSNLWMARKRLLAATGWLRPDEAKNRQNSSKSAATGAANRRLGGN